MINTKNMDKDNTKTKENIQNNEFINKLRIMINLIVCLSILCLIIGTATEYDTITIMTLKCTDPNNNEKLFIANETCQSVYEEIVGIKPSIIGLLWFRCIVIVIFGDIGMAWILLEIYKDDSRKKATVFFTIMGGALGFIIAASLTESLTDYLPWIIILPATVYLIYTGIDMVDLNYIKFQFGENNKRITALIIIMGWCLEWVIFGTNCALVRIVSLDNIPGIRQKAIDIRWYGWGVSFCYQVW